MIGNNNDKNKRQIHPRSLENLRLGAEARNQDKIRRNTTLLPETIEWLEKHGNVSSTIDAMVASAKKGEIRLNSDNAHEQIINKDSDNAHDTTAELEGLRSRLAAVENEREKLQQELAAAKKVEELASGQGLEIDQLRSQLQSNFEHAQHELKLQENIATQVGREKDELKRLLDQTQLENKNLLEENKGLQAGLEKLRIKNEKLLAQQKVKAEDAELLRNFQTAADQAWADLVERAQATCNGLVKEVEVLRTELQKSKIINQQLESSSVKPEAIALLKNGLRLKANAGGAIKLKIQNALELLGEAPYE